MGQHISAEYLYDQVKNNALGAALLNNNYTLAECNIDQLNVTVPINNSQNAKTITLFSAMLLFPQIRGVANDGKYAARAAWLFKHGADVNAGTYRKHLPLVTMLDVVLEPEHIEIVWDFIKKADPAVYAKHSPFFPLATMAEHKLVAKALTDNTYAQYLPIYGELIAALAKRGFNINAPNKKGQTPLMIASNVSDVSQYKFIKSFIANGASVTAQDKKGRTACDYAITSAIRCKSTSIIDAFGNNFIISRGMTARIANVAAVQSAHIVVHLKKLGANFNTGVNPRDNSTALLDTCMEKDVAADDKDFLDKITAIYPDFAAHPSLYECIKIDRDMARKDSKITSSIEYEGWNALGVACVVKNDAAVKFLITNGFDTTRLNADGFDVFAAVQQISTLKLLVKLGVKPFQKCSATGAIAKNPFFRLVCTSPSEFSAIHKYATSTGLFTEEHVREAFKSNDESFGGNVGEIARMLGKMSFGTTVKGSSGAKHKSTKNTAETEQKIDDLQGKLISNLERENERVRAENEELKKRIAEMQRK